MKINSNTNSCKLLLTSVLLALVAPTISAASSQPEQPQLQQPEFSSNFGKYFEQVASDELQGRAPATIGEARTARAVRRFLAPQAAR